MNLSTQPATKNAGPSSTAKEKMLFRLSGFLLNQILRDARLTVLCRRDGQHLKVGRGVENFTISIDEPQTIWEIVSNPDPGAGELFMDDKWEMVEGDIGAFITMMARNLQTIFSSPAGFIFTGILRKKMANRSWDIANSKENVQHHYDIGNDLYQSFLDEGMNYSCAFFDTPAMSLRDAQLNKLRTTMKRLDIQPGMRVLDIGCGWGEAARIIAQEGGAASVTGITLANNQLEIARKRAQGMVNPPSYLLQDYREHAAAHVGAYDRIVSIGMFEHVGEQNYRPYFAAVREQLAPGGRALIHSIMNASREPGQMLNGPWLERYIFPGGRIPDLQEMLDAAWDEGLRPAYPLHLQPPSDYAETLRRWRANFLENAHTLDAAKYDGRFHRMWIFYLAMCEAMFDGCGFQIGQIVFEKADNTAV